MCKTPGPKPVGHLGVFSQKQEGAMANFIWKIKPVPLGGFPHELFMNF